MSNGSTQIGAIGKTKIFGGSLTDSNLYEIIVRLNEWKNENSFSIVISTRENGHMPLIVPACYGVICKSVETRVQSPRNAVNIKMFGEYCPPEGIELILYVADSDNKPPKCELTISDVQVYILVVHEDRSWDAYILSK